MSDKLCIAADGIIGYEVTCIVGLPNKLATCLESLWLLSSFQILYLNGLNFKWKRKLQTQLWSHFQKKKKCMTVVRGLAYFIVAV